MCISTRGTSSLSPRICCCSEIAAQRVVRLPVAFGLSHVPCPDIGTISHGNMTCKKTSGRAGAPLPGHAKLHRERMRMQSPLSGEGADDSYDAQRFQNGAASLSGSLLAAPLCRFADTGNDNAGVFIRRQEKPKWTVNQIYDFKTLESKPPPPFPPACRSTPPLMHILCLTWLQVRCK